MLNLALCILIDSALLATLLIVLCASPTGIELFVLGLLVLTALRPAYAKPLCAY